MFFTAAGNVYGILPMSSAKQISIYLMLVHQVGSAAIVPRYLSDIYQISIRYFSDIYLPDAGAPGGFDSIVKDCLSFQIQGEKHQLVIRTDGRCTAFRKQCRSCTVHAESCSVHARPALH